MSGKGKTRPSAADSLLCRRHRGLQSSFTPSFDTFNPRREDDVDGATDPRAADLAAACGEDATVTASSMSMGASRGAASVWTGFDDDDNDEVGWCSMCMVHAMSLQLHEVVSQLEESEERSDRLVRSEAELRTALDSVSTERDAAVESRDTATATLKRLEVELSHSREMLQQLRDTNTSLAAAVSASSMSGAALESRLRAAEDATAQHRDQVSTMTLQVERYKIDVARGKEQLEAEAAARRIETESLRGQISTLEAALERRDSELAEIEARSTEAAKEALSAKQEAEEKSEQTLQLQLQLAEKTESSRTEVETLKAQLAEANKSIKDLTTIKDTMRERVRYLESSVQELSQEVARARPAAAPSGRSMSVSSGSRPPQSRSSSFFGKSKDPSPKGRSGGFFAIPEAGGSRAGRASGGGPSPTAQARRVSEGGKPR